MANSHYASPFGELRFNGRTDVSACFGHDLERVHGSFSSRLSSDSDERRRSWSASTVHQSLERPRSIGAVRGTSRGIRVLDPRRLQLLWAARRDLERDIVFSTRVALPVREIEARLPASAIPIRSW
jgi:hypothetical protein